VPPREYAFAARLLVRAVESDASGHSRAALRATAYQLGLELGSRVTSGRSGHGDAGAGAGTALRNLETVLAGYGYQPERRDDDTMRLRNCPFHLLARAHRDTVCAMNLALIEGVTAGLNTGPLRPLLDPQPGQCCVIIEGEDS
jgi:predicted ArsR family transcriptional regulator